MSCEDCKAARENDQHRLYTPRCSWCGARYAQAVRKRHDLKFPARVDNQDMSRREWFEFVLATWAAMGHDHAKMRELAMGAEVPYAPVAKRKKAAT